MAREGVQLTQPASGLFIDSAVYDWMMLDEFQILAYWSGHYEESLEAALRILDDMKYPPDQRERLLKNADFAREKVLQRQAASSPAPAPAEAASAPVERVSA